MPNRETLKLVLERTIKDVQGRYVSNIFVEDRDNSIAKELNLPISNNAECYLFFCQTMHDLFGDKSYVDYPVFYETICQDTVGTNCDSFKLPLIPELIMCHAEFFKLSALLVNWNVTKLKIRIIENWQYKHGEILHGQEKQNFLQRLKQRIASTVKEIKSYVK